MDKYKIIKESKEDIDNSDKNDLIDNSDITLINNAFEYYDKFNEKYKDKFNDVVYISLERKENDLENSVLSFYNKQLKLLFSYKFERIGLYDTKSNIWSWAWTIPYFNKNETNTIRKILYYGAELNTKSMFLKTELVTSRFRITNNSQLDMHCAIASYLAKKQLIFKYKFFSNPEIIDNKYVNILYPKYTYEKDQTENYELIHYVYLLEEI
jgi:hypothetical protein